jgi:hypothetical protein
VLSLGYITITGSNTSIVPLVIEYRLAGMLDPANFSITPVYAKLNFF